jgi:hypothetical protein
MKARLTYGPFTCEMDIDEPRHIVSIPKPMSIHSITSAQDFDVAQAVAGRLDFILKKSPRLGELVEYVFEGES